MRIKSFATVVALSLAVVASSAFAEPGPLKLDAVRSQQAEIRQGVQSRTGIYKQMSEGDRDVLLTQQIRLLSVIGGKQTAADLNAEQRTEVFNALERIEALINRADDERMVCEYRTTIGSNRKKRECMTVAQKREQREALRNQIDNRGVGSVIQGN